MKFIVLNKYVNSDSSRSTSEIHVNSNAIATMVGDSSGSTITFSGGEYNGMYIIKVKENIETILKLIEIGNK
jgi:hypothetical protein